VQSIAVPFNDILYQLWPKKRGNLTRFFLAPGAPTVDLQPVTLALISKLAGDAFHKVIHAAAGDVLDLAAVDTDQVMMVPGAA
jgi:hypothetical protein